MIALLGNGRDYLGKNFHLDGKEYFGEQISLWNRDAQSSIAVSIERQTNAGYILAELPGSPEQRVILSMRKLVIAS